MKTLRLDGLTGACLGAKHAAEQACLARGVYHDGLHHPVAFGVAKLAGAFSLNPFHRATAF